MSFFNIVGACEKMIMKEDVEELFLQLTGEANDPQLDKKIYMHISLLEIFENFREMTTRKK